MVMGRMVSETPVINGACLQLCNPLLPAVVCAAAAGAKPLTTVSTTLLLPTVWHQRCHSIIAKQHFSNRQRACC